MHYQLVAADTFPVGLIIFGFLLFIGFIFKCMGESSDRSGIDSYIRQLTAALGPPKKPVPTDILRQLYAREEFPKMLGWIKNAMHINLRVGLRIVDGHSKNPMWIEMPTP